MSSKSACTLWLPSSGSHVYRWLWLSMVWIRSGERGCHTTRAAPAWYSLRRTWQLPILCTPPCSAVTRLCSARLKNAHNLGVPAVTFSRSLCFDPCTLLISTARLFPLYSAIARFNVGGQSSIFRVEVNFWSQSRGQGFRDFLLLLLLQQSEINSMYKKVSQQLSAAQSGGQMDSRGQRYKHPTAALRFWLLHCFIWFVTTIR